MATSGLGAGAHHGGAILVDLVDQHLDAAADHAFQPLRGNVLLVTQQPRLALLADSLRASAPAASWR
jgi:hypothetical protein